MPAKSDVSDFARFIAAEVGQGRLRVKAGHAVTPANQVVTGSPAFAGDDTQVMQLFRRVLRERKPASAAGGLGHGSLNEVHQTKRQQRRRNDDVAQDIEALQVAGRILRNHNAGDDRGDTA